MAIFKSYASLPEGIFFDKPIWSHSKHQIVGARFSHMEFSKDLPCWNLSLLGCKAGRIHPYFWVNYNELTTSSLEIIVSKGNHPQMALIQVSELL